ncbi:hypothetical protein KIW84_051042 [Lathyrus oleraceus]|uniref:Uncharacterized protein n=1 Tax=Pisum sativum TaxID=3888 RepID=A0A9D4WJ27_PEA|nr:hypothetical protein KIW84_051042 [Pisum sativum]
MATLILNTSTPSQFTFQPNTIPNPNFISLNLNFNKRSSRSTSSLRATHQDSNPQNPQDAEVDNLGVKAALSILRFYKREFRQSCRGAVVTFQLAVSIPWRHIRGTVF